MTRADANKAIWRQTLTKVELNEAIAEVLMSEKKYYCEESYRLVKKAGYIIRKDGDHFEVSKEHEGWRNRYVYLESNYKWVHEKTGEYHRREVWTMRTSSTRCCYKDVKPLKVDYVALLDAEFNDAYASAREADAARNDPYSTKARKVKNQIRNARWDVKYYGKRVDESRQEIAKLQNKILSLTEDIEKYGNMKKDSERKLADILKQYNLA